MEKLESDTDAAVTKARMFVRSAPFVKTVSEWAARSPRRSARAAARKFARGNMVAVIHKADDSAIAFLFDVANDRVVEVNHKDVEWVL